MARTTSSLVEQVLAKDYDFRLRPSLFPYIRAAAVVVGRVNECAVSKGITLSETELTEIETWLSAHMYSMSDRPYASKSTEGASAGFQGQTGMYLEASFYGQTASGLDVSGCLAQIAGQTGRAQAGGFWLGRPRRDLRTDAERNE